MALDPQLQGIIELLGYAGATFGFLKVAKVKAYNPCREFIRDVRGAVVDVKTITKELGDNGGKSIKDSINRIDRRTLMTDARQSALMAAQPEAMFEADCSGHFTSANRAFEELTGFSRAHLTGMEWVNAIHVEDQFRVVKAWQDARDQQRAWLENCRILTATGKLLLVRIEAHPMRESIGDRNIVGWCGIVCVEMHG